MARTTAKITLSRVKNFSELNAPTEKEGNEIFKQKTRELWTDLTIHGILKENPEKNGYIVLPKGDLDGESCLYLLRQAGIDTSNVSYVAPGGYNEGSINMDTSNRDGTTADLEDPTAFIDHHGKGSKNDTSAAEGVYNSLMSIEMLEKRDDLDQLVNFVNICDNALYPEDPKAFTESSRTLLGLQQKMLPQKIAQMIKDGIDPLVPLTEDQIIKYKLTKASQDQEKTIKSSLEVMKELEENGCIIDSPRYGKIVVDIGGKLRGKFFAVRTLGYDSYLIWNQRENSFFFSSKSDITDQFPQGKPIRNTMWMKSRTDKDPLTLTPYQFLAQATDGTFSSTPEFQARLKALS